MRALLLDMRRNPRPCLECRILSLALIMETSLPSPAHQTIDEKSPVNLLSLDGGGIRGVSELTILHEIMLRVQSRKGLAEVPKPCDYFHLIGGTSTGGQVIIVYCKWAPIYDTDFLQPHIDHAWTAADDDQVGYGKLQSHCRENIQQQKSKAESTRWKFLNPRP
ncbi:hypothetical protein BDZ97DRAFT_544169 [Flammula alnicola]|nr:hypothetical protein BDZ97DRAFT_544169 [Flammula alnicola]